MANTGSKWIATGAALAGLAVVAGAFGAHGLEKRLSPQSLETFEVAVRYQMYHSLALVLVGLMARRSGRGLFVAGLMFLLGIGLFSGCLYALVLSGSTKLGMIVPVGGVFFVIGWLVLAAAAISHGSSDASGAE